MISAIDRPEGDRIVYGAFETLFATQISLGGLDRDVTQHKLDLL
jgi:hypothetical protein